MRGKAERATKEVKMDEESIKEEEEEVGGNDIGKTEGYEEEEEGNGRVGEETWRMAFWNVAGIKNKDEDFWEGIKEWDVIVMMETWMDEKEWEKEKEKLPREYKLATRKNRKDRACGRMLLGLRKSVEEVKEGRGMIEEEGRIEDKKLEELKEWTEEGEKGVRTIVSGDFNARTGKKGGWEEEVEGIGEKRGRKSKDKKVNKDGRKLLEFIEERGWMILNGGMKGDEEGEFTYTGEKGETVIDYVIGNEKVRERVERLEVGERVDSAHHPLILWVRGSLKGKQRRKEAERIRRREIWSKEGRTQFRERLGMIGGKSDLQEEIEEGTSKIRRVIKENEKKRMKEGLTRTEDGGGMRNAGRERGE
ncbi:hypothetical protein DBV15_12118 [Temnothorax longispinosus]|uniref:Endonuclease/exonuclease/phosphatase domain-containing protein n=1 Tax=Temnothorax longispinosus TaxID=300112 RepID=A0A4S2KV46_9HYME|nr:hypothetical protein DBV15_12118 [Temnothorax longispinosus]